MGFKHKEGFAVKSNIHYPLNYPEPLANFNVNGLYSLDHLLTIEGCTPLTHGNLE